MRVLLVTGSYPPDVCGTADYTARLNEALQQVGVDAHVFYRKGWGLRNVPGLLEQMDHLKPSLIHMQYPTTGYGWKLGPQGIGVARPLVMTLHEASQAHPLRQLSLYPFLMRGRHFIFTNEYESRHVRRLAPWIGDRSTTIPIGINIPLSSRPKVPNVITCFSIVRPEKGLEDVIEMARLLSHQQSDVLIRIVGAVMPRWTTYFETLRAKSATLPICWLTGLDQTPLSEVLAETNLAYLPFPDGASERRSSLVAMLANQACVMTTVGKHTPKDMRSSIVEVASPADAARTAARLLSDQVAADHVALRGSAYAKRFDWKVISQQHRKVYEQSLQ